MYITHFYIDESNKGEETASIHSKEELRKETKKLIARLIALDKEIEPIRVWFCDEK